MQESDGLSHESMKFEVLDIIDGLVMSLER